MAMALRDLLDAERALGRLVEALDRPGARDLWRADALRREALASAELDGCRVDWEDLVVAQLDPMLLPYEIRPSTALPLRLMATANALERGIVASELPPPAGRAPRLPEDRLEPAGREVWDEPDNLPRLTPLPSAVAGNMDLAAVLRAARQSAADIDAFILRPATAPPPEAIAVPAHPSAEPLSAGWLAAAWERYSLDPAPLPSPGELAVLIKEALSQPGLAGVAAVLHRLERHGPFPPPHIFPDYSRAEIEPETKSKLAASRAQNQPVDPKFAFIRLLAPWLMARACGLPGPRHWISPALLLTKAGYTAARNDTEQEWASWLYPTLAAGFDAERRRLRELTAMVESWEAKFAAEKRRWSSSRRIFLLLANQPAVTTKFLEGRCAFSRRAAQMLVAELAAAGILRHVPHARGRNWWVADQVR